MRGDRAYQALSQELSTLQVDADCMPRISTFDVRRQSPVRAPECRHKIRFRCPTHADCYFDQWRTCWPKLGGGVYADIKSDLAIVLDNPPATTSRRTSAMIEVTVQTLMTRIRFMSFGRQRDFCQAHSGSTSRRQHMADWRSSKALII